MRTNIKNPNRRRTAHTKSVARFDMNNKFIDWFHTAEEATEKTGIYFNNIREVCNFARKSAGGYIWRYANPDISPDLYSTCNCCGKPVEKRNIVSISVECLQSLKFGKEVNYGHTKT